MEPGADGVKQLKQSPLVGIFWRGESIFGFFLIMGMAHAVASCVRLLGSEFPGLHPGRGAEDYTTLALLTLYAMMFVCGFGLLLTGGLMLTLACQFTWFTRDLRGRLRRDSFVLLGLFMLPALGLAFVEGAPLGIIGVPLLCFVPGLLVLDPRVKISIRWVMMFLILALGFSAELLVEAARAWPLLILAIGLLSAGTALPWSLAAASSRTLLLQGDAALGNSARHPFIPQPWERKLRSGTLRDVRWSEGVVQDRRSLWRAIQFERWGWSSGRWLFGSLGPTAVAALVAAIGVVLVSSASAWRIGLEPGQYPDLLFSVLARPTETEKLVGGDHNWLFFCIVPSVIYLTALILTDRMQPSLRPGELYPMSRYERADLYWRGALKFWTPVFLGIAFGLGLLTVATGLVSSQWPDSGVPPFLLSLALLAATFPLLQLMTLLKEFYPGEKMSSWAATLLMITLATLGAVALTVGTTVVKDVKSDALAWLFFGGSLVVAALAQLVLKSYLSRKLSKMDLV
ncbi:MAG: hypothetical protein ACI8PQ_003419 [Planctomycetota bacterium]|jgi:hypothetical protein